MWWNDVESRGMTWNHSMTPSIPIPPVPLCSTASIQAHGVVVDGGRIGVSWVKFCPGIREGHWNLPMATEGIHLAKPEELLRRLVVACVQISHEDLKKAQQIADITTSVGTNISMPTDRLKTCDLLDVPASGI